MRRWTAVGIIWGVALGLVLAFAAGSITLGVLYLYVFGDSPWPDWSAAAVASVTALTFLAGGAAGFLLLRHVVAERPGFDPSESRRRALYWGAAGIAAVVLEFVAWGTTASTGSSPTTRAELPNIQRVETRLTDNALESSVHLSEPPLVPVEVETEGSIAGREGFLFRSRDTLPAGFSGPWRWAASRVHLAKRIRAILLKPGFTGRAEADVVIRVEVTLREPGAAAPERSSHSTVSGSFRF